MTRALEKSPFRCAVEKKVPSVSIKRNQREQFFLKQSARGFDPVLPAKHRRISNRMHVADKELLLSFLKRENGLVPFRSALERSLFTPPMPHLSDKPDSRKACYVEEIPLYLFHKYGGSSLDSIGARFIKGLFLMYIIPNFFLRQ